MWTRLWRESLLTLALCGQYSENLNPVGVGGGWQLSGALGFTGLIGSTGGALWAIVLGVPTPIALMVGYCTLVGAVYLAMAPLAYRALAQSPSNQIAAQSKTAPDYKAWSLIRRRCRRCYWLQNMTDRRCSPGSASCGHETVASSACSTPTGKTSIGDAGSWRGIDDGRPKSSAGISAPLLRSPKNVCTTRMWTGLVLRLEIGARTKTQFNGVGRPRTYISFTHSA
jgi:hypothetical protein